MVPVDAGDIDGSDHGMIRQGFHREDISVTVREDFFEVLSNFLQIERIRNLVAR